MVEFRHRLSGRRRMVVFRSDEIAAGRSQAGQRHENANPSFHDVPISSQSSPNKGVSSTLLRLARRQLETSFTTVCFSMNAGSISMPDPGPVGTVTTPFSVFSEDVAHSNGTVSSSPLNSW